MQELFVALHQAKGSHMLLHLQKPDCYLSFRYPEGRMGHQPRIQSFRTTSNNIHRITQAHGERLFTRTTTSLAANTRISAQETIPGHAASSSALMESIISKPFRVSLGGESFSERTPLTASNNTDASHPWTNFS